MKNNSPISFIMKFTTIFGVVFFVTTASALPATKEFHLHDALKASIDPQQLTSIQNIFNKVQNLAVLEQRAANEMDEMQCMQNHLDNITAINDRSNVEIQNCTITYLNATQILDKEGLKDKNNYDKQINTITKNLVLCEKKTETEDGLQCHANLKYYGDNIKDVSSAAQKSLDFLRNKKEAAKMTKNHCINDSVDKARREIDNEHSLLLKC